MRRMIFLMCLLTSCTVFKEKSRLRRDSLSRISISEQWQLKKQWQNSAFQFKDSNSLQSVWIKADAPFRWQADSGLSGEAGNYQLYLTQRRKVLKTESQSGEQEWKVKRREEGQEVHKSVVEEKKVTSSAVKMGLVLLLILSLVIGLVYGLRRIWK